MTLSHREARPSAIDVEVVDLSVPADPAYLAVMRTATAGLATHLDLTVDEVDDLRTAVDEACALLLDGREHPDRQLNTSFRLEQHTLTVRIDGPAPVLPGQNSFSWAMLNALAGDVTTGGDPDGSWIRLTHTGREVIA